MLLIGLGTAPVLILVCDIIKIDDITARELSSMSMRQDTPAASNVPATEADAGHFIGRADGTLSSLVSVPPLMAAI